MITYFSISENLITHRIDQNDLENNVLPQYLWVYAAQLGQQPFAPQILEPNLANNYNMKNTLREIHI